LLLSLLPFDSACLLFCTCLIPEVSNTDIPTYECRNALSARNNPGIVTRLLQEEIDKGFIRGPLGIATHKYSKKQRLILIYLSEISTLQHKLPLPNS
jgi:hypothetical protein